MVSYDSDVRVAGRGDSAGGGGDSEGGGGGPHTHGITLSPDSPYSAVEEWTRVASFVDGQMYQTGIEVDTDLEFLHVGLVIDEGTEGADAPRELSYQRIRTAEWEGLELDSTTDGAGFQEADNNSGVLVYATDDRFNVISLHLRRYQNADGDDLLSVGVQIASDQPSNDIKGIKYFYEEPVTAITGNTNQSSGSGGGGGGAVVDVSEDRHPPTITEDNYESLFVDFNWPPRIWEGYKATHTHEDAQGDFTSVTDDDLIDPGVFRDDAHAGSPSAFMVYYSKSRHSWRARVLHEGRGVVPDRWVWVDYSWHSIRSRIFDDAAVNLGEADTDAELVAQVSDHDSALNYYGINLTTNRVRFLTNSTYVAPVDATPTYGASPVVPDEKPYLEFWGFGQTDAGLEEIQDRSTEAQGTDEPFTLRLRWHADGPNRILQGSNPGTSVRGAAPSDANALASENIAANSFVTLTEGDWELFFQWSSRASSDTNLAATMYAVASPNDTPIIHRSSAIAGGINDALGLLGNQEETKHDIIFGPFVYSVPAGETHDLTIIVVGLDAVNAANSSHYLLARQL